MKNEKIVRAWDRATPDQYQKEKMRTALELRMEAEPSVREKKVNRNLDVYRLPAGKKKRSWLPIAAMLALVLAGALALAWLTAGMETPTPSMVTPTETGEEAAFQPILDKYITAINEGWDSNRCAQEQISVLVGDVKSQDDLGYVYRDMNGDGQEELLITDGYVIYGMYALVQGEAYQLLTGWDGSSYFLSNGNLIGHIASSSASVTEYDFMSYTERTLFENHGVLRFDGERDPENPWLFQEKPVNEAMAEYILSQRPQIYIRHTPFSDNQVGTGIPDREDNLLLFADAIPEALENYSKDQPVTFCFYDADGDGEQEVILGVGKICYATLSISESTGEVKIAKPFGGEKIDWFFCENGVRKYMYPSGNGMDIDFARNTGMYYETYMSLRYDENQDSWTRHDWAESPNDKTETTVLTQTQVQEVLESYRPLNLDWQPIEDFPATVPASPRDLFENAFVPIATQVTDRNLDTLVLLSDVREWGKGRGQARILNPADKSSELKADITGEEGKETIEKLTFTMTVNEIPRTVSVEFTPEGPEYRAYGDPSGKGVKMNTVDELRTFLIREERLTNSWLLAEEFAYAWFSQDQEAMDKAAKNGAVREQMDWQPMDTEIESITMQFPGGNYVASADASIAFYEPGITDSYTYLDLHMFMDDQGEWFVETMWIEK